MRNIDLYAKTYELFEDVRVLTNNGEAAYSETGDMNISIDYVADKGQQSIIYTKTRHDPLDSMRLFPPQFKDSSELLVLEMVDHDFYLTVNGGSPLKFPDVEDKSLSTFNNLVEIVENAMTKN